MPVPTSAASLIDTTSCGSFDKRLQFNSCELRRSTAEAKLARGATPEHEHEHKTRALATINRVLGVIIGVILAHRSVLFALGFLCR